MAIFLEVLLTCDFFKRWPLWLLTYRNKSRITNLPHKTLWDYGLFPARTWQIFPKPRRRWEWALTEAGAWISPDVGLGQCLFPPLMHFIQDPFLPLDRRHRDMESIQMDPLKTLAGSSTRKAVVWRKKPPPTCCHLEGHRTYLLSGGPLWSPYIWVEGDSAVLVGRRTPCLSACAISPLQRKERPLDCPPHSQENSDARLSCIQSREEFDLHREKNNSEGESVDEWNVIIIGLDL